MAYAIVQKELVTPELESLTRAFCTLSGLTMIDAQNAAHDAFGILWRGLDAEQAWALQAALGHEGIQTDVVREAEFLPLATPRTIRHMRFTEEHLAAFDSMQRPLPIPWSDILLVAAGNVHWRESRRRNPLDHPDDVHTTREEANDRLVIDLFLTDRTTRFSIVAGEFDFETSLSASSRDTAANHLELLRKFEEHVPHASLNQGAFRACQEPPELFRYPSRQAYQEEIVWLLWQIGRLSAKAGTQAQ